jgi:hypothetical protein
MHTLYIAVGFVAETCRAYSVSNHPKKKIAIESVQDGTCGQLKVCDEFSVTRKRSPECRLILLALTVPHYEAAKDRKAKTFARLPSVATSTITHGARTTRQVV